MTDCQFVGNGIALLRGELVKSSTKGSEQIRESLSLIGIRRVFEIQVSLE